MKKLILGIASFAFLFASCETEPLAQENLRGIEGKGSIKQKSEATESSSNEDGCETAFGRYCECASQNTCFSDYGISRWGWSVELKAYDSYKFNLFAGAGQCVLDKGEYVGWVNVTFHSDGTVTTGPVTMEDGFSMTEFHFYSGDTKMPLGNNGSMTAAPGQYTNTGDLDDDKKVYVIVHAVVCPDEN